MAWVAAMTASEYVFDKLELFGILSNLVVFQIFLFYKKERKEREKERGEQAMPLTI